jgi:hypothetical protein
LQNPRNFGAGSLAAYAQSVKASGAVANFFKDRLNNWPIYAAAAGSALALSTSAMADIISMKNLPGTSVSTLGNDFKVSFTDYRDGSRSIGKASLSGLRIATMDGVVKNFASGAAAFGATKFLGTGPLPLESHTYTATPLGHVSQHTWGNGPISAKITRRLSSTTVIRGGY